MVARIRVFLTLCTAVWFGGCATLRVASDYDHSVSFEARHTYDWAAAPEEGAAEESEEMERVNPFLERRLERAVDNELGELGFEKVEDGPVDFLVAVSIIDPEGATFGRGGGGLPLVLALGFGFGTPYAYSPFGYGFGGFYSGRSRFGRGFGGYSSFGYRPYFGYGYGSSGYYRGGSGADLGSLGPGSFVVDILDGESGELIWRGWANGALGHAPDLDGLPDFIASVVHDIMKDFPPDSGS